MHDQRLVVGQDLGAQTQDHQAAKHQQAVKSKAIALEALPSAATGGWGSCWFSRI
jgi:hypothetical protein